jgi:tetratricopeptide (TPR) repeat protein
MKRTVPVATLLSILALSSPVPAQPTAGARASAIARADELLRTGLERYEAGDYAGAVSAFEAGYSIDPRPAFLFAAAQAERLAGNCVAAIAYYDRFLATSPSRSQADAAAEQRAKCADAEPEPEPEPAPAPAIVAPAPRSSAPTPWYRDPLTDSLVGGSAVLVLAGVGFTLSASSATDDANAADTYDRHDDAADRASLHRTVALVSFAGGAVVGAFAAWRIVRHGRDGTGTERAALRLGPGPGVGLAVGGAF